MKKFVISFTISLLAGLFSVGLFVFVMDPFYHYHRPWFGTEAYMDNAIYQTPGAAQNLDYDAVVIGSSMTENFRSSWFDEMGMRLLKLSYAGAEFRDYETILEKVFSSGHDIKLVVTDINEFQLLSDTDAIYKDYPKYLYNGVTLTDTQYLFNNDVFWESAGRILDKVTGDELKYDDSYTWEEPELFSEENARRDYDNFVAGIEASKASGTYESSDGAAMIDKCTENMDYLISIVRRHPTTDFVIYYPPYSMLFWAEEEYEGRTDATLELYKTSMMKLVSCENVHLFSFQDDEEIITDLNRYRDVCHHDPQGNRYIYECIRDTLNGNECSMHVITSSNIDEHIDHMRAIISGQN